MRISVKYIRTLLNARLTGNKSAPDTKIKIQDLVVSLTSYGERVESVDLTILSLLNQTYAPEKMILWLAEDKFEKADLPASLLKLQDFGLEIAFCKDFLSYKKLIPSLGRFPNRIHITFDDDVIYPENQIERLIEEHTKTANTVIAHRAHRAPKDNKKCIVPYVDWEFDIRQTEAARDVFPIGIGGVLYPPGCFDDSVLDEAAFMKLCPKADDLWFKVMALKNGTLARVVDNPMPYKNYLLVPATQQKSLWQSNKANNDKQLKELLKAYPNIRM